MISANNLSFFKNVVRSSLKAPGTVPMDVMFLAYILNSTDSVGALSGWFESSFLNPVDLGVEEGYQLSGWKNSAEIKSDFGQVLTNRTSYQVTPYSNRGAEFLSGYAEALTSAMVDCESAWNLDPNEQNSTEMLYLGVAGRVICTLAELHEDASYCVDTARKAAQLLNTTSSSRQVAVDSGSDHALAGYLAFEGAAHQEAEDGHDEAALKLWSDAFKQFNKWISAERQNTDSGTTIELADVFWDQFDGQLFVKSFETLQPRQDVNWGELHRAVKDVVYSDYFVEFHPVPEISINDHTQVSWFDYWQLSGETFFRQALGPDALRRHLVEVSDRQAEHRLRTYFFSNSAWNWLPDEARRNLVNADHQAFTSHSGLIESLLDPVLISLEAIFEKAFRERLLDWSEEPTSSTFNDPSLLRIQTDRKSIIDWTTRHLATGTQSPSITDWVTFLNTNGTESFLRDQGFDRSSINWLTQEIPRHIRDLREERGKIRHPGTGRKHGVAPQMVLNRFRQFLGAGQEGIIPNLAELFSDK